MSAPDRGSSSRRRGAFNHWVPLVLTLTVATVGVAAWAWSQRNNRDDEYYEDDEGEGPAGASAQQQHATGAHQDIDYENADYGENPPYGASGARSVRDRDAGDDGEYHDNHTISLTQVPNDAASTVSSGWGARMSDVLGGGANAQQWMGNASKAVTAGLTAASAAVGGALASMRDGDKDAFADHETWTEEAEARKERGSTVPQAKGSGSDSSRKRRTVAIVVSAEGHLDSMDEDGFHEHAIDFSTTRVFVLIYAPGLKETSMLEAANNRQPTSLSSSFSNIGPDAAQSPKEEAKIPVILPANAAFNAVNAQALALVQKEKDIIPFTTASGYVQILHFLEPDVVYLEESLTGTDGAIVNQLQNWMHNDIIVVVGAESGYGGLADSESETEKPSGVAAGQKWWQKEERVGRGRGVVVVDGARVNDDWVRRVQGKN